MAWYKTGTVAVTNASTTVTGTGTNFVSGAQVGDGFLGPNELLYEITAINSATSLTIAPAYGGATASSQSYAIAPTQGLVATLASDVTDLITDYQSVVDNAGAGKFGDGSAASPAIRFTNDQDTGFFKDTANEIAFATAGVKRGEFSSSGIQMLDGQKFIAGTGSDLQIYHDGSGSYIEDTGTGNLKLKTNGAGVEILNSAGLQLAFFNNSSGEAVLKHINAGVSSTRLNTTSTGIDVTGTVTADGLTVATSSAVTASLSRDGSDGDALQIFNGAIGTTKSLGLGVSGTHGTINSQYGGVYIQPAGTTSAFFGTGNDISFYEDTGTTAKFFWDASAESLGIGTSSPVYPLVVQATNPRLQLLASGTNTGTSGILFGDADTATRGQINYTHTDNELSFVVNAAEAMRIDSSGNTHIGGTASITTAVTGDNVAPKLIVEDTTATSIAIFRRDTSLVSGNSLGSLGFYGSDTTSNTPTPLAGIQALASGTHAAGDNPTDLRFFTTPDNSATMEEAMRIDGSGNLMVGKDITNLYQNGFAALSDGQVLCTSASQPPIQVRRNTDGGDLIKFLKDATTVGSIGAESDKMYLGTGAVGLLFDNTTAIKPYHTTTNTNRDALTDLGASASRFKDLYLSGGVVFGDAGGSGTSSSNTFDSYEEGSFTPAFYGATSVTHDVQVGRYTKVGNLVRCEFTIGTTSLSGSQTILINGLPFTQAVASNQVATRGEFESIYLNYSNLSTARYGLSFSSNMLSIRKDNTGGGNSALAYSDVSNNGLFEIRGSITYRTGT